MIPYKLLKNASQIGDIENRVSSCSNLCQNRERIEKELPALVEFLPLDYLTLRDAVTVQDCLLPPWETSLTQAVRMAHSCGSLLPDICAEIRRMSATCRLAQARTRSNGRNSGRGGVTCLSLARVRICSRSSRNVSNGGNRRRKRRMNRPSKRRQGTRSPCCTAHRSSADWHNASRRFSGCPVRFR